MACGGVGRAEPRAAGQSRAPQVSHLIDWEDPLWLAGLGSAARVDAVLCRACISF